MVKDQRGYRRTGSEEIAVNPEAGEISHGKNFFRDKRMTTCKGCGDKGTFFSFLSPVTQKYKSESGQSRGAAKLMAIYLQANEPALSPPLPCILFLISSIGAARAFTGSSSLPLILTGRTSIRQETRLHMKTRFASFCTRTRATLPRTPYGVANDRPERTTFYGSRKCLRGRHIADAVKRE